MTNIGPVIYLHDHAALRDVASCMVGMGVCRSSRKSVILG
jgi:hypothetical protein